MKVGGSMLSNVQLSDVTVSNILNSHYLPVIFNILSPITSRLFGTKTRSLQTGKVPKHCLWINFSTNPN